MNPKICQRGRSQPFFMCSLYQMPPLLATTGNHDPITKNRSPYVILPRHALNIRKCPMRVSSRRAMTISTQNTSNKFECSSPHQFKRESLSSTFFDCTDRLPCYWTGILAFRVMPSPSPLPMIIFSLTFVMRLHLSNFCRIAAFHPPAASICSNLAFWKKVVFWT